MPESQVPVSLAGIEIIGQDLRAFTVQIRSADDVPVGTGVTVSVGGLIATCLHVVRAAGVDPRSGGSGGVVRVRLPRRPGRSTETRTGTVVTFLADADDDVVLLQVDGVLPLPPEAVAVLGPASGSRWHRFRSYGYRHLDSYHSAWAEGLILGEVEPPEGLRLRREPVQLRSEHIDLGMSGAAVLDVGSNLVVAFVSESWLAGPSQRDRDTAWAVDADVLAEAPFEIPVRRLPLPMRGAVPPMLHSEGLRDVPIPGSRLADAPARLAEWAGREPQLSRLDQVWDEDKRLVVGLVGFGGEGKSSLARRWLDTRANARHGVPEAVFWWSFTARASPDEFLASALKFVSGGRLSASNLDTTAGEAVAALLSRHRYLFVLDNLEIMQDQGSDGYGTLLSEELRRFLEFFATPGHASRCLITSRATVADLLPYATYLQIDVNALDVPAGRTLLRNLGVHGSDAALDQVVRDWDGHALTLSLIASYLVKRYQGDVRRLAALPPPDPSLGRDELVRRILREYDACLTTQERRFLTRFSVLRTPVDEDVLDVVRPRASESNSASGGDGVDASASGTMLRHLVAARIIRRDEMERLSMHPLVRDFYHQRLSADPAVCRRLHAAVRAYYLRLAEQITEPTHLDDLAPAIEAAHHAIGAGDREGACDIIEERLYMGDRGLITRELNAYESTLDIFTELFPGGDLRRPPQLDDVDTRSWVLHETGTCLQMLGRLREAAVLIEQAMAEFTDRSAWHDAAVSCQNLTELMLSLGALPRCHNLVDEAFRLARMAEDQEDELVAETLSGALAHYEGRRDDAEAAFAAALRLAREATPLPILYSTSGLRYADHLHLSGRHTEARVVHLANLDVCREVGWRADEAACHVGLGDLALDEGHSDAAVREYEEAVTIARSMTRRDVLVHALLARSRWATLVGREDQADADIYQALTMAQLGGYRLAEIDAHIARARLCRAQGEEDVAWTEALHAEEASQQIRYHWGLIDARTILGSLR